MNPFKENLRQVVFLTCAIFSSMSLPSSSSSSSSSSSFSSSEEDSWIPVPTNVEIKMVNETTAILTWDSNNTTDDVIGYNIFVKCDTRPMYCCGPCEVNETTEDTEFTFSVEGATTYYAMVASRTNQSTSTWSTEVPLRTNPTVPNKPYIEELPDKKSFTFNLTYGCPYTGPADYVFGIEGKQSTAKSLGQDRCSYAFTVDELVPFTEYKYSLMAKNEGCRGTAFQGITYPQEDSKTSYEIKRTTKAYTQDSSSITGDVATESNITITTTDAPSITDDVETESNISITTTDAPSITDDVETESNIPITSDEMSEPPTVHSTTRGAPYSSASTEEPPSEGSFTTEFVKHHEICSVCFEGSVKTSPDIPSEPHITSVLKPKYKGQTSGHMTLTWRKPNVTNGNVKSYLLHIQGGDHTIQCEIDYESRTRGEECYCRMSQDYGSCNIVLRINTTYKIQLKARNEGMDEYGPPAVREIITETGWPYLDGTPYNKLSSSELKSFPLFKSHPIQIRKEKFQEHNGPITKCQILLAEGINQNSDQVRYFDDMSSRTSTFQGWIVYSESTLPDRFIFGRDESQCELGETCNAFLDPSKTYQFLFRVFSGSKYTESMTYSFTTKVACRNHEFICNSGECIDDFRQCDYVVDCPDGEDEALCLVLPKAPRITSDHAGGEKHTYTVTWDTKSYTPIVQYRFRYRKSSDRDGWSDRLYSPNPTEINVSGHLHHMNHVLEELETATDYEATVSVDNTFGWSDLSDIFYFHTWKAPCGNDMFKCFSGECIDGFRVCDDMYDCPDYTDESICRFG